MMHVLIFEPHAAGHRAVFVRYLLESMERHGGMRATWLASEDELQHPQIAEPGRRLATILQLQGIRLPSARIGLSKVLHPLAEKQFRYMGALRKFIAMQPKDAFDFVFIPFIDDYALAPLAMRRRPFFGLRWGGIVISPRFHLGITGYAPTRRVDAIERILYALLLRRVGERRKIFTIDPFFADYWANPGLVHVPDPAVIKATVCSRLPPEIDISQTDLTILVYGYLDQRKGIPELLQAFADPRIPSHAKLLLVGAQHKYVRSILDQPLPRTLHAAERLIQIDRVVTDEEESAVFRRADIVWNFYPQNYGPSGVLVRAGQASKPVICTEKGYCGRMVATLGMGLSVKESDTEAIVQALLHLLSDHEARRRMGRAGLDYFSRSSPSAFADPIVSVIGAHREEP